MLKKIKKIYKKGLTKCDPYVIIKSRKGEREDIEMNSTHYTTDRQRREAVIRQIGYGVVIKRVEVDRGHRNGLEIHTISDTGIITIYNKRSGKMITKLIARPGQLRRYFEDDELPEELLALAIFHTRIGLNNM